MNAQLQTLNPPHCAPPSLLPGLPHAPPLRRVPPPTGRALQWSCPPRVREPDRLAPAPGAVPESGSSRRDPPVPWVLAAALLFAGPLACARMDAAALVDAGPLPSVEAVLPAPGPISAPAAFQVTFTTPMDPSLLLSDLDRSETLGLVPLAQAEVMAAALGHSRLTAREKALLLPAVVQVDDEARTLSLAPAAPLAPGDYALLFSPRLRSADGRKLTGSLRFQYQVRALPPRPALLSPLAGSAAPRNLRTVRLDLPEPRPAALITLVSQGGALLAAAATPSGGGEATLDLCPGGRCAALAAGDALFLTLGGTAVDGASFTIAGCTRDHAPSVLSSDLRSTATGLAASVSLDWPARVTAQWAAAPEPGPGSSAANDDDTLARLCDQGGCSSVSAPALGAPAGCDPLAQDAAATAQLALEGLASGSSYLVRLLLEDDEGHRAVLPALRSSPQSARPAVLIEEVMASPPLPQPRSDGEYVELFNPGPGPVDTGRLALRGADNVVRPFSGTTPLLAAGARALAVGLSFDAARSALPAGVVLLRAPTQRLLARGLTDDGSQPFALVWLGTATTPTPVELSRFPGEGLRCSAGRSFERVHPDPKPGAPLFACGALGGSPGKAP